VATIEESLYVKLSSATSITDLVDTRICPQELDQSPTYPAIVYQRISSRAPLTHDAVGDFWSTRFQFDCYGATYAAAHIPHKILGRGQQTCVNLIPKGQVSGKGENSKRQQTKVHNEYPHDVIRY